MSGGVRDGVPDDVATLLGSATVASFVAGDRVLVALGGDANRVRMAQMHALRDVLRGRFPGVEFTVVAGVTALAVQHVADVGDVVTSPELGRTPTAVELLDQGIARRVVEHVNDGVVRDHTPVP